MKQPANEATRHIFTIVKMMFRAGIHLEFGTDMPRFQKLSSTQSEKTHFNPAFDTRAQSFKGFEGIWIIGRNRAGEIVHTQAIKLIDLHGSNLADHFHHNVADFRSYGHDFDLDCTEIFLTDAAAGIQGLVTYHGELWLKGGPGGIRGGSMVVLLTRLMLMMAVERWSPDFMFGLQSPMTAYRGLSAREGYAHLEQRSIVWYPTDGSDPQEDWLVWMNAEEAAFNLRLPPEYLDRLFTQPAYEQPTTETLVA